MDDVRIGNAIRVLRIHQHLRQSDVARRARIRPETVSRLERGGIGRVPFDTFRAVATALGIRVDVRLRWHGGELERVVNAAHAEMHGAVAGLLGSLDGWVWRPEVSFSIYGERGVIDILAWHAQTRSLLVIELKTELIDPQELVATMGRRLRLAPRIAHQLGWDPLTIGAWVVALDTSTNRRWRRRHLALLGAAFGADGRTMRRWLRRPQGHVEALSFWSIPRSGSVGRTVGQVRRVRRQGPRPGHAAGPARDGS